MRSVPEPYSPPPEGSTPAGFLRWLIRMQWTTVLQGSVCDIVWLLGLALTPWAIGRAIDEGLVAGDGGAFLRWLAVVVWLQLQHSLIQGLRDRAGSVNFERAASRVNQVIAHAATGATVAVDRRLRAGAIVTLVSSDTWMLGFVPLNVGSLLSALVSFTTVSVLLLRDSVVLGLLVIVGVPAFTLVQFTLVRSLHSRQWAVREESERMNAVAADSVRGMRVLRGIGGEEQFLDRFRRHSTGLSDAAKRAAWPLAAADGLNVLIAGVLVAALTWIGALLVAQGELQIGALVAFYGYAGFMMLPVTLFNQVLRVVVGGLIGARKIVEVLGVEPLWESSEGRARDDESGAAESAMTDAATGLVVREGELLGVVLTESAVARALVDRLGRLDADDVGAEGEVTLRSRGIRSLPIADVRARVVVADPVPFLFSGTLRSVLDPRGRHDDPAILRAVAAVDAIDVVEAVGGLDVLVGERGVEFSGGQRQRLGVARVLLSDPEILVLHDPTSSVDAPTEERMAQGIRSARRGRTTVVVTASPLVLTQTDRVAHVVRGAVVSEGTHDDLLRRDSGYRRAVLRAQAQPNLTERAEEGR
ncbi:ABC-type multidrug transport system fused ATPase/permease subunit [Microbacterium natoriense]|uniref:ABC-type multidrug transport system fused ATPase/permease subunit n=1 Tax=Microbacterium natoriense TaxID=284570 RepID=A0AAW8ERS9_9MICO|nr:ABC transporter ATP-binding protein [Microbacterium natoriense]MDQ0645996.1 ABC-type multidrug transport system fused ATPase/permease subunit [Microbacterium natoriense]